MNEPTVEIPKTVPVQKWRPCQENIPQDRSDREHLRVLAKRYAQEHKLTPPMPGEELQEHAIKLLTANDYDPIFADYTGVLINNMSWQDKLAAVPFERRLLLLPKCLRVEERCPAPFDEFGLLCKQCGLCTIQDLQEEAEKLGYAVLVAEGSAIVMAIIETGKIEAIVGVSCLSVLEKAFPFMEAAAVPGISIPLLQDDCANTNIDLEWLWEIIHLTSDDKTARLDLDLLRDEVRTWFSDESLENMLGPSINDTDELARKWLSGSGKRWRPFLAACVHSAYNDDPTRPFPDEFKKVAVAVECFHKASLIHDDIEDEDEYRYGQKTMHSEHGTAVALNVGDLLIGEGYRLLAETGTSADAIRDMVHIAAVGHRRLSLGQGAELDWSRAPGPLAPKDVLEIFRRKTAPAFEVALRTAAAYCGATNAEHETLATYSTAIGIAYQISDDIKDNSEHADASDVEALRPSIFLALADEKAKDSDADILKKAFAGDMNPELAADLRDLYVRLGINDRVDVLLESYKEEAVGALRSLENANLKGLLRRVMGRIFNDLEIKGWCREFETENAPGSETLADSVA